MDDALRGRRCAAARARRDRRRNRAGCTTARCRGLDGPEGSRHGAARRPPEAERDWLAARRARFGAQKREGPFGGPRVRQGRAAQGDPQRRQGRLRSGGGACGLARRRDVRERGHHDRQQAAHHARPGRRLAETRRAAAGSQRRDRAGQGAAGRGGGRTGRRRGLCRRRRQVPGRPDRLQRRARDLTEGRGQGGHGEADREGPDRRGLGGRGRGLEAGRRPGEGHREHRAGRQRAEPRRTLARAGRAGDREHARRQAQLQGQGDQAGRRSHAAQLHGVADTLLSPDLLLPRRGRARLRRRPRRAHQPAASERPVELRRRR